MRSRRTYLVHAIQSRVAKARLGLRHRVTKSVVISDGPLSYRYRCETWEEYNRAHSLAYKEPGTYAWLRADLTEGSVFYDIGANVGSYTIPAAFRVGASGAVVAFEPHVGNAASLLRNVAENGVQDRVTVLSLALHDTPGMFEFRYSDWEPGAAMSQLDARRDAFGHELRDVGVELKTASTADSLIAAGAIPPATHVKLDVDGNELQVLRGMTQLLTSETKPLALQVEVNLEARDELLAFLGECGYELTERHLSEGVEMMLTHGSPESEVPFNGIFRPAG